jgi:hypothetical protein
MKFTEEKLEKAFTELLEQVGLSSFLLIKLDKLRMSSYLANKLDKYSIFALKLKNENS